MTALYEMLPVSCTRVVDQDYNIRMSNWKAGSRLQLFYWFMITCAFLLLLLLLLLLLWVLGWFGRPFANARNEMVLVLVSERPLYKWE